MPEITAEWGPYFKAAGFAVGMMITMYWWRGKGDRNR